jgi:succinate dehydrogenase/fumarate reductase-like Fe-S protein
MATQAMFRIWRGDSAGGRFEDYLTPVEEGMVVLDAVHRIQAQQAPDLACDGIARPASAAPVPLKLTGCRSSCA